MFTPKYRKKLLFGKIKRHLGQVFHDLARRKECRIEDFLARLTKQLKTEMEAPRPERQGATTN